MSNPGHCPEASYQSSNPDIHEIQIQMRQLGDLPHNTCAVRVQKWLDMHRISLCFLYMCLYKNTHVNCGD